MKLARRTLLVSSLMIAPALAATDPLAAAIAAPLRSPRNRARDKYRHPDALLRFFGLRPTQSVLEIEPGGGYWTEILAPYLAARGHYTAALPTGSPATQKEAHAFRAMLQDNPQAYGRVSTTDFGAGGIAGPEAAYDLVLSFRNLHDWLAAGTATAILASVARVLKPGGVFGIEDHRAPASQPQDLKARDGYVREDYAISLIEAAGLRLVARSPVGDNPRDTKTYPDGVWDLPPTLRQGAKDRAHYLAIGESDRWTLKFQKPA